MHSTKRRQRERKKCYPNKGEKKERKEKGETQFHVQFAPDIRIHLDRDAVVGQLV